MRIIDVHNHLYPKEWLDYLEKHSKTLAVRKKDDKILIYFKGTRLATIEKKGHIDPEARLQDMDEKKIDVQIISLSTPSVELAPKRDGIPWAKRLNDYFATLCQRSKGRFQFYAVLPLQDIPASIKELERAKTDLGAKGIIMFSNVCGKPIYFQEFYPIYEAASSLNLPILIHPGPPITSTVLKKVMMPVPLFGFVMDTTIAVTGLIYFGIFDRFPDLKIIHPHLGGVFPYLVGRINDAYKAYGKDYRFCLKKEPSQYYRENVYVDSISFHTPSLLCAIEFMGTDRVLFGTDYAHPIGGIDKAIKSVRALNLKEEEKEKIFSENAKRLFKI
ncbi:MAG: amidohydrolase [Deltaproteobacteria bacterium]|nr:amidohydrolase [Deltaproteobacteria bacterium]